MRNVRRLILALSSLIGVWLLASFGGAMFDAGNAIFWTNSLMWALLSCLIVMPALLMVSLASTKTSEKTAQKKATQEKATQETSSGQEPFIQEESEEARTLWPEPEQDTDWPAQQQTKRDHAHA